MDMSKEKKTFGEKEMNRNTGLALFFGGFIGFMFGYIIGSGSIL